MYVYLLSFIRKHVQRYQSLLDIVYSHLVHQILKLVLWEYDRAKGRKIHQNANKLEYIENNRIMENESY